MIDKLVDRWEPFRCLPVLLSAGWREFVAVPKAFPAYQKRPLVSPTPVSD